MGKTVNYRCCRSVLKELLVFFLRCRVQETLRRIMCRKANDSWLRIDDGWVSLRAATCEPSIGRLNTSITEEPRVRGWTWKGKGIVTVRRYYHKFTISISGYKFQWSFFARLLNQKKNSRALVSFFMVNSISCFRQTHPPPFYFILSWILLLTMNV